MYLCSPWVSNSVTIINHSLNVCVTETADPLAAKSFAQRLFCGATFWATELLLGYPGF